MDQSQKRKNKVETKRKTSNSGSTTKTTFKTTKDDLTLEEWRALKGMCRRMNQVFTCTTPTGRRQAISPATLMLDLGAMARTLIVRLQLPDPTPQVGPDPTVNEWKMAAVGYPLWLWTNGPRTVTSRVRASGITFTLRATWLSTSYTMGDGHTVNCTSATPYTKSVKPGAASPTCGYTYQTASLPHGNYTITATTNWRITWSALGVSGSLPGTYTGTRTLPVGELNALVIR
ncbi:MAG: hypothetical protein LCH96_01170 [Actinobacteria bacterium]|nr:hypothetical protein [Actinomycetota bacterium]